MTKHSDLNFFFFNNKVGGGEQRAERQNIIYLDIMHATPPKIHISHSLTTHYRTLFSRRLEVHEKLPAIVMPNWIHD